MDFHSLDIHIHLYKALIWQDMNIDWGIFDQILSHTLEYLAFLTFHSDNVYQNDPLQLQVALLHFALLQNGG